MAVCPECWTEKPFLSPRCPNCNQEVKMRDTFSLTAALWGAKQLAGIVIFLFIVLALFG